ncbi:hypothetical protein BGZ51_007235 [Haplosporangium sp. Z 767]|nr:hypothetical protein BGZ51_007235 [Haplosporangium sp. Z 767]
MAATVKAWHRDDCRRLSINLEQIQYQDLKEKLQNTFQLENEFTVKYADVDGDLCTIGGTEEFDDLINSDLVKERKGTLRLQVIPKNSSSRRPSILHRRNSSDQSGTSTLGDSKLNRTIFDKNALAELPPGASSWVSAGKNLITPTSAQNFQRLNYARAVRAKFPVSNSSALLNGLDSHVYNWSVETTEHDITGDVLLDLTHDTLKDMGMVSTGRRIRLLKMIAELRLHVADLTIQEATDEAQGIENLAIN